MSTFIQHHPEQQEDEIYMGNGSFSGFLKSSWQSKRRGQKTFDSSGQPLDDPNPDFRPWFVKRSEVEKEVNTAKIAFTKQTLNEMLLEGKI